MRAAKVISLQLPLLLFIVVSASPPAWADKPAPGAQAGPPLPSAPLPPDISRPGSMRMDMPRPGMQAYADRSSNLSIGSSQASGDQSRPATDIPLDSRDGLHMVTEGERPALEYKLSDTGSMRLRTTKRGAKVVMVWQFK
ncbi:MAG: hypothetical protein V4634_14900 [Pseudomonadota bacterium]